MLKPITQAKNSLRHHSLTLHTCLLPFFPFLGWLFDCCLSHTESPVFEYSFLHCLFSEIGAFRFEQPVLLPLQQRTSFFRQLHLEYRKMGCQNSNMVEVIPVDPQLIHEEHHQEPPVPPPAHRPKPQEQKENQFPSELSIKLQKEPSPAAQPEAKRKSKSEHRIVEQLMADATNLPQPKEEKKRTIILFEKNKTLSAKEVTEKMEPRPEPADVLGPSTHSIPQEPPQAPEAERKKSEKAPPSLLLPIVVEKPSAPEVSFMKEEPAIESLSEEMKSQRTVKSFRFQVYVQSSADILSRTQLLDRKLEIFMEKEEVAKYLNLIEYGEREEILGKLYEQLQKKEEWREALGSSSCEPLVVVVAEKAE